MIVQHVMDKSLITRLEARGVHRLDIMHGQRKVDLERLLAEVSYKDSTRITRVPVVKQIKTLKSVYKDPFNTYKCIGISSRPSDLLAKHLALWVFAKAYKMFVASPKLRTGTRSPPLWHRVYGGLGDKLLDSAERPNFLVLSNVTIDSTNYKVEKVRDLLEHYHDIPKIVVVAGTDPLTFFRQRLYYPLDGCIQIGGAKSHIKELDL